MKVSSKTRILDVLDDHLWHSGLEFVRGEHGFFCLTYAQRISELRRDGWDIETSGRGGHEVAVYRLRYAENDR